MELPNVTDTVEGDIRKDQHQREIKHKETARDQIKKNMDVNGTFEHVWCMQFFFLNFYVA